MGNKFNLFHNFISPEFIYVYKSFYLRPARLMGGKRFRQRHA